MWHSTPGETLHENCLLRGPPLPFPARGALRRRTGDAVRTAVSDRVHPRRLKERGLTDIVPPAKLDMRPVRKVHDRGFLAFLKRLGRNGLPQVPRRDHPHGLSDAPHAAARAAQHRRQGRLLHARDQTAITAGTWRAAQSSAAVALTAQKIVAGGASTTFALCRPPGHHAAVDMYGGYCFLNNASIAAQAFIDQGARVAILDVDFHHGNGTQDIFYGRDDVLFLSLHGHAGCLSLFPRLCGRERARQGRRVQRQLSDAATAPLSVGARRSKMRSQDQAVSRRTFWSCRWESTPSKKDPISFFKLESEDFTHYGARIAKLEASDALHHGRRLCRGSDRYQYGERARRLPRSLTDAQRHDRRHSDGLPARTRRRTSTVPRPDAASGRKGATSSCCRSCSRGHTSAPKSTPRILGGRRSFRDTPPSPASLPSLANSAACFR